MRLPVPLLLALALAWPAVAGDGADPPESRQAAGESQAVETLPDPQAFLARLIERYRRLELYEDTVSVVEQVERDGERPHRVETRLACRVEGDRLRVATPGTRAAGDLDESIPASPAMSSLVRRYNLWQAPHLALRFLDEPLRDLRAGVSGGFEVATAELVTGGGPTHVRVRLESVESDAEGERAVFTFLVDPESMLINRIEGRQRLPDGARYQTTMDIDVVRVDGASAGS